MLIKQEIWKKQKMHNYLTEILIRRFRNILLPLKMTYTVLMLVKQEIWKERKCVIA